MTINELTIPLKVFLRDDISNVVIVEGTQAIMERWNLNLKIDPVRNLITFIYPDNIKRANLMNECHQRPECVETIDRFDFVNSLDKEYVISISVSDKRYPIIMAIPSNENYRPK